jgi:hypothetical protein
MHGNPLWKNYDDILLPKELSQNIQKLTIFIFFFLRYSVAKFLHLNKIGNFQTFLAQKQNWKL